MSEYNERTWVSFKELRARLKFEDVLGRYKVEIRSRGEQHQGPCPLPSHGDRPNVAPFSAHLGRGIFRCWGCKSSGNLIEFAALMEGVDPEDGAALRRVSLDLQEALLPKGAGGKPKAKEVPKEQPAHRPIPRESPRRGLVNAPLDFELKDLEHEHPALTGGRLELKTVVHFGAGFCSRGMLKGKVAIPLHDPEGRLVGYAGADTRGKPIDRCAPEYSLPQGRDRKGVRLEFDASLLLYNAQRVGKACDELIVVRDFASVWWLHQCGYRNAVSVLGGECSERQAALIAALVRHSGKVRIVSDDEGCGEFARSVLSLVSRHHFVRWVMLEVGQSPTDLTPDGLKDRLAT